MELHNKNSDKENRLIVLFFYSKMSMPLKDITAEEYIVDNKWMNYFDVKEHILDLLSEGYLEIFEDKKRISAKGLYILDSYKQDIPFSIRDTIDNHAKNNRASIQRDMDIYANYSHDSSSEYPVTLKLSDNNKEVLILSITAGSAQEAEKLCEIFRNESVEIYADIVSRLSEKIGNEG